jgi:hypothetical protein
MLGKTWKRCLAESLLRRTMATMNDELAEARALRLLRYINMAKARLTW